MSKRKPKPPRRAKAAPRRRPPALATLPLPAALEIAAQMLERIAKEIRVLKTFT